MPCEASGYSISFDWAMALALGHMRQDDGGGGGGDGAKGMVKKAAAVVMGRLLCFEERVMRV